MEDSKMDVAKTEPVCVTSEIGTEAEDETLTAAVAPRYLLECPICLVDLDGAIYQCRQGHIMCSTCRPKFNACPTCREVLPVSDGLIRNRALEGVVEANKANSVVAIGPSAAAPTAKREHTDAAPSGDLNERQLHSAYCDGPDCQASEGGISGVRYQCLECRDYDLCQECVVKGVHDHHLLLRIATPTDLDYVKKVFKRRRQSAY